MPVIWSPSGSVAEPASCRFAPLALVASSVAGIVPASTIGARLTLVTVMVMVLESASGGAPLSVAVKVTLNVWVAPALLATTSKPGV